MTGRLQPGDTVRTPDGVGVIQSSYHGSHVVAHDDGTKRVYLTKQLTFVGRQLRLDDNQPAVP